MPVATFTVEGAGVSIQVLQSSVNFASWQRSFTGIARQQGVWKLYKGEEEVIEAPVKPKAKRTRSATDVQAAEATQDFKEQSEQYKLDLEEYRHSEKKVRMALSLLTQAVDESLHQKLFEFDNPKAAYDYIVSQFSTNKSRALVSAYNEMERVRLTATKTMSAFLNELRSCKADILAADGKYDDAQLVAKISRSLPRDYDDFVQENIELADTMPKYDDITAKLILLEPKFVARAKYFVKRNENKNKSDKDDKDKDKEKEKEKKDRPRCTQPGCGRIGHTAEQCWVAHPELRPVRDSDEKSNESKKDAKDDKKKTYIKTVKELSAMAYVDPHYLQLKLAEAL